MRYQRHKRVLSALALCAIVLGAGGASAATSDTMRYNFTTDTYDSVFDHLLTATRYTQDMRIEMSVTIEAPLAANLDNVPFDPQSWSYSDGIFKETGSDRSRFNGFVSTDSLGTITGFLLQIYLDAPNTPGVWIRRDARGNQYATAIAREVQVGVSQPRCAAPFCDATPVTEWAQDRATGSGDIEISFFANDAQPQRAASRQAPIVSTPLPAPILMLLAGLGGITTVRRSAARTSLGA